MGKHPVSEGSEPGIPDPLHRSASIVDSHGPSLPGAASAPIRPLGGRRISLVAWGLAGVVGILLWTLIIKLA